MSERIPCATCTATILPSTAAKTGGRCVPCATGTRANIEAGAQYYRDQKKHLQSPEWAFWTSLVERVHSPTQGFYTLTQEEQLYYAVNCMNGDVYNGGFHQYFSNHAGEHYLLAVAGLQRIGAVQSLDLLKRAHDIIFSRRCAPVDAAQRREFVASSLDNEMLWTALEPLERLYWSDPDGLSERLDDWIQQLVSRT